MIFFLSPQTDRRGTKQRQMQSLTEGKLLRTEGRGLVPEPAGSNKELAHDPSSYALSVSKTLANNCPAEARLEKVNTFICIDVAPGFPQIFGTFSARGAETGARRQGP